MARVRTSSSHPAESPHARGSRRRRAYVARARGRCRRGRRWSGRPAAQRCGVSRAPPCGSCRPRATSNPPVAAPRWLLDAAPHLGGPRRSASGCRYIRPDISEAPATARPPRRQPRRPSGCRRLCGCPCGHHSRAPARGAPPRRSTSKGGWLAARGSPRRSGTHTPSRAAGPRLPVRASEQDDPWGAQRCGRHPTWASCREGAKGCTSARPPPPGARLGPLPQLVRVA
ncbi:hypothetical protein BU14_2259s0001 [Porphyra umbilicalis]|uniref:Uncharacterized protein n=1 Tax=Porphyra umbilicalis TaxID=2786 RepID=A0A1X6NJJ4_PORUM|nr:hypothetical protein BU14_2259s0001 [Porphyra umbilicalis]|eukprot:OSX68779.1 hypothetical protein BU14_2259s0001 [Porphyra umbilicalis]